MKQIFVSVCTVVILAGLNFSCNLVDSKESAGSAAADTAAALANAPKIAFEEDNFDFGKLKEGDIVEHKFVFTNVGKSPLQIFNVGVQCGCTVAKKPETAIGVGQKDTIVVSFNSTGKVGVNKKFVTVYSNANPAQSTISFTAEVLAKEAK
ncbi:DUF1573 domain-containing protein [Emticicia sp. TH156]|uniref:DUF1573 domain-containing protein n=1 Tax=Emticicia sp. TH156 TaxID=2067454 RepID=UPI000C793168|nr:DUF1573 domain-containing protein [Emticicia sp. TH156]PLK45706.1 hypothetical protein C0V77_06175 [Emticicia sp. TH156]